jgi:sorbose reductase
MITRKTLDALPEGVHGPAYDIGSVTPGIVHFGVGNFFRAHQAYYVDRAMALPGASLDWGIIGVGLTAGERSERKARTFREQDCLYSLTETAASGESHVSIIGALRGYELAPGGESAVLDTLASPAIRIVSMTITEGGYNIDENTGQFRLDTDAVRHDLANPDKPRTIFGFVVEALRRRREAGHGAFTVMSCDNLRHNGDVAKRAFLGFAKARDADLAAWIEANATFPNGMVDRITPTVSGAIAKRLNDASGLDDELPLVAEDFTSWILEDHFCAGRPPLEKVGVKFVPDVTPYEHIKIRILNASHIMLAFPGILLGYEHVHEALADPDLKAMLSAYLDKDVLPQIEAPADVNLQQAKEQVLSRFSNAAMADQLLRVGSDGCSKVQVFWTETVRRSLQAHHDLSRIAFGIAVYLEVLCGHDERGGTFELSEPTYTDKDRALAKDSDLAAGLKLPAFDAWRDLDHAKLDAAVVEARRTIREKGVKAALPR